MTILHKYWFKEFFTFFFIIHLIVQFIFVAVDFFSRMDKFLESEIALGQAFEYIILKVPFMFVETTPAVVVLSVIVVFGLMNRNNELTAVRSSGVSIYHLLKPAAFAGFLLSILMMFFSETVVPVTMSKANYIKYTVIKGHGSIHKSRKDIWIKQDEKICHVNYFNPADKTVSGLTVSVLDKRFSLISRIDAEKGYYQNGTWHLSNVIEQQYDKERDDYGVKCRESMVFDIGLAPADFQNIAKKSEEMSLFELSDYINKVEAEGYDATTYRVDFYAKIAFPFICFLMAVAGTAIGMRPMVKKNLAAGVGAGILMSFFYWIVYSFCVSLGYGKILSPFISAWAANFVFLTMCVINLLNTE